MTSRLDVVATARGWIGTRWRHQGRTREGCDCAGLVLCVARELGLIAPDACDVVGYPRLPANGMLGLACGQHMARVAAPDVGCVALMRFEREPQHLGIFGDYPGGGLSLIHAYASNRKVVEHRLDENWRGRIVAVFDLPGVA